MGEQGARAAYPPYRHTCAALCTLSDRQPYPQMAYDKQLAQHIEDILSDDPAITIKEKMGGCSFMRHGKLLVRVEADTLVVRCDPAQTDEFLAQPGVGRYTMKGKQSMKGWLVVAAGTIGTDEALAHWLGVAMAWNKRLAQG